MTVALRLYPKCSADIMNTLRCVVSKCLFLIKYVKKFDLRLLHLWKRGLWSFVDQYHHLVATGEKDGFFFFLTKNNFLLLAYRLHTWDFLYLTANVFRLFWDFWKLYLQYTAWCISISLYFASKEAPIGLDNSSGSFPSCFGTFLVQFLLFCCCCSASQWTFWHAKTG